MASYDTLPLPSTETSAADTQAAQEVQRKQIGQYQSQQFVNELNFWTQSLGPVSHAYLDLTGHQDPALVLGAAITGTDAATKDINQYSTPYNPYMSYSPYGYGAPPQPYSPYMTPYGTTSAPYDYGTGTGGTASTTSGSMTTGEGTSSVSAKTSSTKTTGVSTTGSAMTTSPYYSGVAAAPYAASYGYGGGYSGTGTNGNQLLGQISSIGESQMEMLEAQYKINQQMVWYQAVSNIMKASEDARMNAVRNMRSS